MFLALDSTLPFSENQEYDLPHLEVEHEQAPAYLGESQVKVGGVSLKLK